MRLPRPNGLAMTDNILDFRLPGLLTQSRFFCILLKALSENAFKTSNYLAQKHRTK
jgi:hypothetical protein